MEDLRVLNRRQTIDLVGVSTKTWERLESLGDIPIKTRLSEGRIGFRVDHIRQWLDGRQEPLPSARELGDSNWLQVGDVARAVTEKVQP